MKREVKRYYIKTDKPKEMADFINKSRYRYAKLTAGVIAYNKIVVKPSRDNGFVTEYLDEAIDRFPGSYHVV